jgi:hypothetical protein
MVAEPALTAADEALLARVAARVVELRLEVPAVLALETARPLSVVAGQGLVFLQPIAEALFPLPDYERFARLVQRRDALESLTARIEAGAEAARAARSARRGGA